jgi:hypothetical protein
MSCPTWDTWPGRFKQERSGTSSPSHARATVFTKNRDRLLEADVARKFLAELLDHNELRGLLSDEHFSVDGTQIAAWA